MCSIIGVAERLHKVLGQIDLAHWTQVSDRCPLGYLSLDLTSNYGVSQPSLSKNIDASTFPGLLLIRFIFFKMRFDIGTLDSGEGSLPFGLLV